MDPRLVRRRRKVAAENARRGIRRALWAGAALTLVGGAAALLNSSYLSVQSVEVRGVVNAEVEQALARHQVDAGRPMAVIRPGQIRDSILEDPWVRTAAVRLRLPNTVEVEVEERRGVAWVSLGADGWALTALDGVVVGYAEAAPEASPVIRITTEDPGLGVGISDDQVLGSLRYLDSLPLSLASQSGIYAAGGEIWATVGERHIRLGPPIEMAEKAKAVVSVISLRQQDVIIDVIAPDRPAVRDNVFDLLRLNPNLEPTLEADVSLQNEPGENDGERP